MAQNITIAGASYTGVPRIDVPKTGGGVASFEDASSAKTALTTWLTDNGVTVPTGAGLDALVALLDGVEAGGGGGETLIAGHKFASGSFTPSEDITSNYTITWSTAAAPDFVNGGVSIPPMVFFYRDLLGDYVSDNPAGYEWLWALNAWKKFRSSMAFGQTANSAGTGTSNKTYIADICDYDNNGRFTLYCTTSKKLIAGHKYNWIAISYKQE